MEILASVRLNGIRALPSRSCSPPVVTLANTKLEKRFRVSMTRQRLEDVQIFHAGTKRADGEVKTAGGRVLAVTALGSTLEAARARAYEAVSRIHFENCHYRRDIALGS